MEILKRGGNAVDAAIATSFALEVLEPNASGVGGGGFMIIKLARMKEAVVIDFREVAPGAAKPDMYKLDEKGNVVGNASVVGGLANGVPGEVAGLLYALDNYGSKKLTRGQIIQPAIDWANKGIPVTINLAGIIKDNYETIKKFPACAAIYLKDGLPYEIGDTIKNPDLARTLKLVAEKGPDAIYKGEMAKRIADEVQKQGGILTAEDLANYKIQVRKPVVGTYRGLHDHVRASGFLGRHPPHRAPQHPGELRPQGHGLRQPRYGPPVVRGHEAGLRRPLQVHGRHRPSSRCPWRASPPRPTPRRSPPRIAMDKSMPSATAGDPSKFESGSTTSLSVMDKDGNMVAITKSINYFFGSGVLVPARASS